MVYLALPDFPIPGYPCIITINEGCVGLVIAKPETWDCLLSNALMEIPITDIKNQLEDIERMSQKAWISKYSLTESKRTYAIFTAWQSEYQIIICFRQITVLQAYPQLYTKVEIQHKRTKRICGINFGSKSWTEIKYIPRGLNQQELIKLDSYLIKTIQQHPKFLPESTSKIKLNVKLLEIRLIYEEQTANQTDIFVVLKMNGKNPELQPIKTIKVLPPKVNLENLNLEIPSSNTSKLVQWQIVNEQVKTRTAIVIDRNTAYEVHYNNGTEIRKQVNLQFIPTRTNSGAAEV